MIVGIIRSDSSLMSTEDALKEAALCGNVDGYPLAVLVLALRNRKQTTPTASQVASVSWRQQVLQNLIDYYAHLQDVYPLVRGTLIHSGFQAFKAPEGVELIRERRLRIKIPKYEDYVISGQVDLYYPDHRRLEDYKTCTVIPDLIKPDHIVQLAVYYWLLIWHNFHVDRVAINYVAWNTCCQLSQARLESKEVGEVVGHRLFQDEQAFIDQLVQGWDVLEAGFRNAEVPSTKECDLRYCRNCPVKWVCDVLSVWGETIDPAEFQQRDYR